jgi:hypothetical protein
MCCALIAQAHAAPVQVLPATGKLVAPKLLFTNKTGSLIYIGTSRGVFRLDADGQPVPLNLYPPLEALTSENTATSDDGSRIVWESSSNEVDGSLTLGRPGGDLDIVDFSSVIGGGCTGNQQQYEGVAFTPSGQLLASIDDRNTCHFGLLYGSSPSGKLMRYGLTSSLGRVGYPTRNMYFTETAQIVAHSDRSFGRCFHLKGSSNALGVFDTTGLQFVDRRTTARGDILDCGVSGTGSAVGGIFTRQLHARQISTVALWSREAAREVTVTGSGPLLSGPDAILFYASRGRLGLFDGATGSVRYLAGVGSADQAAWSADGSRLALYHEILGPNRRTVTARRLNVVDVHSGAVVLRQSLDAHQVTTHELSVFTFTPDASHIILRGKSKDDTALGVPVAGGPPVALDRPGMRMRDVWFPNSAAALVASYPYTYNTKRIPALYAGPAAGFGSGPLFP